MLLSIPYEYYSGSPVYDGEQRAEPMELCKYIVILWRRKWVIAVTLAVTVTVVVAGTLIATPTYVAQ